MAYCSACSGHLNCQYDCAAEKKKRENSVIVYSTISQERSFVLICDSQGSGLESSRLKILMLSVDKLK
jgi:uncharacterized protein YbbK (DUF523 family)